MGIKSLPTLSPAVRTPSRASSPYCFKREKLPIEAGAKHVTSEIPEDDLEVPTFLRRKKQEMKVGLAVALIFHAAPGTLGNAVKDVGAAIIKASEAGSNGGHPQRSVRAFRHER